MYWAPGAAHGPHHIFKEWADKYKGKFDDGWDAYRERVFQRQKDIGWIPPDTKLTPRADTMASWDSIPESQRPFQRRLMEVFAGFVEHVDAQVGRLVDGLEAAEASATTRIIFYIFGDNGSSAEGQNGTISELLAQNMIPNTIEQQMEALDKIGGLDALGTAKIDNMYHAGWAWAGDTPFRYTKLVASHFGGTRNPLVISWPKGIKPDKTPRPQFHHVNDIAPTIYDILGIKPPEEVNGCEAGPDRRRQHGLRLRRPEGAGPKADPVFREQRQPRASTTTAGSPAAFGPLIPWLPVTPGPATLGREQGSLGAVRHPKGLLGGRRSRRQGAGAAGRDEGAVPDGGEGQQGLSGRRRPVDAAASGGPGEGSLHPLGVRLRPRPGCPNSPRPGLGRESNRVVVDAGGRRGRLRRPLRARRHRRRPDPLHGQGPARVRIQHDDDRAVHRTLRGDRSRPGKHRIVVDTSIGKPGGPADVAILVDDQEACASTVKRTVAGAFSASETLDVGVDLGSPVSFDYFDRAPFAFNGKIGAVTVDLK